MTYEATNYFRYINALRQAAMTAPYGAQIPRDALAEMIGVLCDHYNARFPIASQMRLDKVMGETPLNVSSTNPMVSRVLPNPQHTPPMPHIERPRDAKAGA